MFWMLFACVEALLVVVYARLEAGVGVHSFLFFSKVEGEKRGGWIGEFIWDWGGVKIYVNVGGELRVCLCECEESSVFFRDILCISRYVICAVLFLIEARED
jgi:hypothetical protein